MKNKDNPKQSKALPQFLCDKCFKNSGLEESLTLGSFLPRYCIVCGETVSKDYNFVWGKALQQKIDLRYPRSVAKHINFMKKF